MKLEALELGMLKRENIRRFRKPRLARNPRTGEKVQVGIKKNIAFRMAKDLKFRINSNTSPAEIDKKIEMMYDNKKK